MVPWHIVTVINPCFSQGAAPTQLSSCTGLSLCSTLLTSWASDSRSQSGASSSLNGDTSASENCDDSIRPKGKPLAQSLAYSRCLINVTSLSVVG